MIISHINGGLGNQMFQYAAGRTLAHLNKTFLKLDASSFEESKLRSFDLLCFNAQIGFATNQEISTLKPAHNFEKAFQYLSPLKRRTYYREREFRFDEKVLQLGKNVYLKGYFQSENYFLPVKDIIKADFTFQNDIIKNIKEFSTSLINSNSVSVHIRRGDFKKDQTTADYHGTLSLDYYKSAIELIKSKIGNPAFFFFSDDIDWVKENLPIPGVTFVSKTITENHFEDLYLMSQCKHNIIANSSFSWWGAWLNTNPEKLVIAPKKWFKEGPKDTQDLLPAEWIKI
ncbi:MAG TPA: alpha-1,2-fucosyltransferase [Chitinophagaceae bacterium]|nr:alpha-1,2-fucosyltransferase [Chitinophagaceae bacterium]